MKRALFVCTALALLTAWFTPAYAYEAITGPTGVLYYDKDKAFDGYTLFSPMVASNTTYLIDMEGNIVHQWKCQTPPGLYAELLPNGNLLRAGKANQKKQLAELGDKWPHKQDSYVNIGGTGGMIQEYDWDGNVVWEYTMAKANEEMQHHTFHRMPNGNTLILGWERMSREEAIKRGRDPKALPPKGKGIVYKGTKHYDFWNDFVREVDPEGKTVWEWHVSDHIGKGPDKLDFNYQLPRPIGEMYHYYDWSHFNTVSYIPETDTVVLNSRNFAEFYFIDHKTGKITYRWGNPTTHDPKAKKPGWYDDGDQMVWGSHCATPLKNGNVLIFDNGSERPEFRRSRAVEIDPKTSKIVWEFETRHTSSFFSHRQGGVQRLPNGNTLICSTHGGHVFEVTPDKEVVWEFVSPIHAGKTKCVVGEKDALPHTSHLNGMSNMIHRAFRYDTDYPGLAGKDLTPEGYICGADCPRFFSDFKKGAALSAGEDVADDEEEDEEDGPTMHSY